MPRLAIAGLVAATCLVVPPAVLGAWNQPVGGPSPINHASDRDAGFQSMTTIAGVPYVAWAEHDGLDFQIRVARLNAAGTDWEEVVGGASPINRVSTDDAVLPRMASFGGVPHVAWEEVGQIRVARLNAAGTDWEELVGGASPINHMSAQPASNPSLAAIDGRPAVAWTEFDGFNYEIRVSRLNAAGTAWEKAGAGAMINYSGTRNAGSPSLASIGGITYVAWSEPDGVNLEIHVARQPSGFAGAWEHVGAGASPVNHADDRDAGIPSLTGIGAVPHVALQETDGTNNQVRVARLNSGGTSWDEIVGGASPINHSSTGSSGGMGNLLEIGGVLYVTWPEYDGMTAKVRVSRLNAAGSAWEQVVGGASPINAASDRDALRPFLTHVGGVPYVSWSEEDAASGKVQIRVARLEPEFLSGSEVATDTAATLNAEVRTFGVPLPVAFEHGPGAGFGAQTAPVTVQSGNSDSVAATATITGLTPFTDYSWRAFGTDSARVTSTGPTRSFRTPDTGRPSISGARAVPRVFAVDTGAKPARRRAARGTTFRFRLSEAARVVFTIQRKTVGRRVGRRCRKPTRRNRSGRRCTRFVRAGRFAHESAAGTNRKRFSGRIGRKRLRPARYRATLVATDPAGNRSKRKRLTFRVVRR